MMHPRIQDIPIHLLLQIRDYIFLPNAHLIHEQCDGEKYHGSSLELLPSSRPDSLEHSTAQDWRSFVNANKKEFVEIKKNTVYYDLNEKVSSNLLGMTPQSGNLFFNTPETKLERIKNLPITDKSKQGSFLLTCNIRNIPPILSITFPTTSLQFRASRENLIPFPFETLTLIIHNVGDAVGSTEQFNLSLKSFPFIKYLTLWTKDRYRTNLRHLLRIHIDPSMQLHSFNTNFRCEFISDQNSSVGAPTTLFQHLTRGRLPLVGSVPENMVGSLQKVDLSYSRALVDVPSLRHVHSLSLRGCEKVEDVSMLGEVYSLNISDCPRIVSISRLGKVKKLSIIGLTGLREGLPADSGVKELWVDAVTYDRAGVSEFQDHDKRINIVPVRGKLVLHSDSYIHIPFSKLSVYCLDLRDNCNLTAMRELVLDSCKLSSMFTPMKFPLLRRLLLLRCEGVEEIVFDHLPGLKVLKIDGCGELKNLTIEHDMDVLELFHKAEVETVTIRGVVNRLVIRGCMSLKLLDVLGEVRESDVTGLSDCRVSFH